jgi:hypothetical protein
MSIPIPVYQDPKNEILLKGLDLLMNPDPASAKPNRVASKVPLRKHRMLRHHPTTS